MIDNNFIKKRLIIVGCGPTGIAALFQAQLRGIEAIGLEAGPLPLSSIHSYINGLVLLSPSYHYEIASIPLDCRDVNQITKEELLHYYSRIISYGKLDIRCNHECSKIIPNGENINLIVNTPLGTREFTGYKVIYTGWYSKRKVTKVYLSQSKCIRVYTSITNIFELMNQRVVIFGGGYSAIEVANALMMSGQSIILLMKGCRKIIHNTESFARMLKLSKSILYDDISRFRIYKDQVLFTSNNRRVCIKCDSVVFAFGAELSSVSLSLLINVKVISKKLAKLLLRFHARKSTTRSTSKCVNNKDRKSNNNLLSLKPNLYKEAFNGIRGVHLAGGILHFGDESAGVNLSILSVEAIIQHISGGAPIIRDFSHLSVDLQSFAKNRESLDRNYDLIFPLRPLAIGAWTRYWRPFDFGNENNNSTRDNFDEKILSNYGDPLDKYLINKIKPKKNIIKCVKLSTGTLSILEITNLLDCQSREEKVLVAQIFISLWQNNVLTWLPPY